MDDDERPSNGFGGVIRGVLFIASAAAFAAALVFAWSHPWLLAVVGAVAVALVLQRWWSSARLDRLFKRGDVEGIIAHWSESYDRIPYAETMAPLINATAFAAFGRVEDARTALASAARGPAWDAAVEHRVFLDAILSIFEGDATHAREQAARLSAMPVPSEQRLAGRVTNLRGAVAALARAFEHAALPGDLTQLEAASQNSPIVHWAMRYGAAIVAFDAGDKLHARALIQGAPSWPEESAFRSFHDELSGALSG
jgi:hypothetical protein